MSYHIAQWLSAGCTNMQTISGRGKLSETDRGSSGNRFIAHKQRYITWFLDLRQNRFFPSISSSNYSFATHPSLSSHTFIMKLTFLPILALVLSVVASPYPNNDKCDTKTVTKYETKYETKVREFRDASMWQIKAGSEESSISKLESLPMCSSASNYVHIR